MVIINLAPWNFQHKSIMDGPSHSCCKKTILNPLKIFPKPIFNPTKYFKRSKQSFLNKVKARIKLLWDQLTSIQPFWWLSKIIFKHWEYFQSLPSPHESASKDLNIALFLINLAQWNFQHKPIMDESSHPYCHNIGIELLILCSRNYYPVSQIKGY